MALYSPVTSKGTVTSWIPLTTLYSPPTSCSSLFRLEGASFVAFDPDYGIANDPNAICQPPAVTTWWDQGVFGTGGSDRTLVSILPLTCPEGWSTVATSTVDDATTRLMCCPSEYSLSIRIAKSIDGNCESPVTSGQRLTYASSGMLDTAAWSTAETTFREVSHVGAIAIVGYQVKPTPSALYTTAGSRLTQGTSATTSQSSKQTSSASESSATTSQSSLVGAANSSQSTTRSSGLTRSQDAGISVGVGIGAIGVASLLVALWILLRRRNGRFLKRSATNSNAAYEQQGKEGLQEVEQLSGGVSELPQSRWDLCHELPDPWRAKHELPGQSRPGELGVLQSPVELETHGR